MAQGLAYLHEEFHVCIIHRDIKSSNVLLDDEFQPRIADFRLARLLREDQTHVSTRGYTAPEHAIHGKLSEKIDTYGYGVVVLEIMSGRKSNDISLEPINQYLLEWAEAIFLGNLSHPNLIKLAGYCREKDHRMLIYEFLARGSVETNLFSRVLIPLLWSIRMKVALGSARGPAFHHEAERPIIYCYFKTSNILLDEEYNAKTSDLQKMGPLGMSLTFLLELWELTGYAAPEYIMTGHLTAMSDVYSYGVVLLELQTGPLTSFVRSESKHSPIGPFRGSPRRSCSASSIRGWTVLITRFERCTSPPHWSTTDSTATQRRDPS